MGNVLQKTFSNAFSWMKIFWFRLKCHWSVYLRVHLTIFHHRFRQWFGGAQATSHCTNQWWLVYRRICASFDLNELKGLFCSSSRHVTKAANYISPSREPLVNVVWLKWRNEKTITSHFQWDLVTHPWPNFNGALLSFPLDHHLA